MQMKTASVISTGLHVAVLLWATLSFTGETFKAAPTESLPVDLVSEKQFSEITKGIKEAPKPVEKPKPLVEKIAEPIPKPVDDLKAKITEKKEIKAAAEKQPEPAPEPKPDPIADKLKKVEKQQAKVEPKPLPPRRPPIPHKPQPKFNPRFARQARSDARRSHRRDTVRPYARHRAGQRRAPVAIGARRLTVTADGAVESAGRHPETGRLYHSHPHPAQPRRPADRAPVSSYARHWATLRHRARQRSACRIPRPALRYAQAGAL
jgi:hypothetical protein